MRAYLHLARGLFHAPSVFTLAHLPVGASEQEDGSAGPHPMHQTNSHPLAVRPRTLPLAAGGLSDDGAAALPRARADLPAAQDALRATPAHVPRPQGEQVRNDLGF